MERYQKRDESGNVRRRDRHCYCERCGETTESALAIAAHGMCEVCLAPHLRKARETRRCFKDDEALLELAGGRHLYCPRCGLVLSRHERDILRAVTVDEPWCTDPRGDRLAAERVRSTTPDVYPPDKRRRERLAAALGRETV